MGEFRQSRLCDDLLGGLVSVSLAIPLAVGYGMFAFTALGDSYFAYGALAGLYAAITAGVVCIVLGDRTTTLYAPRITTTFLLGAFLYHLVHSEALHPNVHLIVLAFFSIIFLGGMFQALFGLVRLGSLIRFTPHPVMAGRKMRQRHSSFSCSWEMCAASTATSHSRRSLDIWRK